ncbi:MAG: DNA polymerase IV, partial [Candidatus Onthovivens sp.]|nr:DNA polymerase IV [Bacilli bacterium]
MSRIILHVDLNAFFVRCEEIKNPSLINKPVAVGGTGRKGIVSTCSYKARSYGIHSGMPMFQAQALCKELIILPCDFKYYNLMSREFVHHLKQFTPLVEQASIDECYMDITESFKKYGNNNINEYLKNIQVGLYNKTKLYCSIGVTSTKFLAKMGSDIKKPNGITIIRKKDIPSIIFPLPIKDYYGIGNKTYPKLQNIGINTIGDLYYRIKKNDPNDLLNNYLMNFKDNIILCLEGKSDDKLNLNDFDPKSIGRTTTFDYDSDNIDFIKNMILSQASIIIDEM